MTRILAVLLVALVVEAVGVVFLSRGLKAIGPIERGSVGQILRVGVRAVTNRDILMGVALEAAFFGALLYLLSQRDVSLIWPLTSLGFVITALAAHFVLGEQVTVLRWAGVVLIVVGATLVGVSERSRQPALGPPGAPPPAAQAGP
jgi:uncharacterized membrane protein